MFKSKGIIFHQQQRIVCNVSPDFAAYYKKLVYYEFPNLLGGLSFPRHGLHITIGQPKLHRLDEKIAKKYHNKIVEWYYDPTQIRIGGLKSGFLGFYLDIVSEEIEEIKKEVVIKELSSRKSTLHLSLFTTKSINHNNSR